MIRGQLKEVLSTLKSTCLAKYLAFSDNSEFDKDTFMETTSGLLKVVANTWQKLGKLDDDQLPEALLTDCKAIADQLGNDEEEAFLTQANLLTKRLKDFSGLHLVARVVVSLQNQMRGVPSTINKIILDGPIKRQRNLIRKTKKAIVDAGQEVDNQTFRKHRDALRFVRELYSKQLETNTVLADHNDRSELEKANTAIKGSEDANTLFQKMADAQDIFEKKIKPIIA